MASSATYSSHQRVATASQDIHMQNSVVTSLRFNLLSPLSTATPPPSNTHTRQTHLPTAIIAMDHSSQSTAASPSAPSQAPFHAAALPLFSSGILYQLTHIADIPQKAPQDTHAEKYFEAIESFEKDDFDGCRDTARRNLADPTLSRYWQIRNLLLIACAEFRWIEAEQCRLRAEIIFEEAKSSTKPSERVPTHILDQLRSHLDQSKELQDEDRPEDIGPIQPLPHLYHSRDDCHMNVCDDCRESMCDDCLAKIDDGQVVSRKGDR